MLQNTEPLGKVCATSTVRIKAECRLGSQPAEQHRYPATASASAGCSGSCCSERSWPRHSALGAPSLREEGFGWESSCFPRSAPLQTSTGPFWSERGCSDMSALCKRGHTSPAKHSKPRNRESCQGWGEQRPAWIDADGSSTAPATRKHPRVGGNLAMAAWDLPP